MLQDVVRLRLCPWSAENTVLPVTLKNTPGPLQGVSFLPDHSSAMVLYGQGFLVYVDLDYEVPRECRVIGFSTTAGGDSRDFNVRSRTKKRSKNSTPTSSNFTIVQRFRSLVNVSCTSGNKLVSASGSSKYDLS